jgi:DNA-3-methyladenine glycosylase II
MKTVVNEIRNGINILKLGAIISITPECAIRPRKDYFPQLIEIIVSQQLSSKAADSIFKKITAYFQNILTPAAILSTPHEILRGLGLSTSKVNFIKDAAQKIENKQLKLKGFYHMPEDEIRATLVQVKGIGAWSCDMFLMFSLARLNILPVNDLGIRKAVQKVYQLKTLPDEKKIRNIAKKNGWHPYCTIASWYLWRSLELK